MGMESHGGLDQAPKSENEPNRNELIRKAKETVAKNIRTIQIGGENLATRLLAESRNPMVQLTGEKADFDDIYVGGALGAGSKMGSVFMQPYMEHKPITEGDRRIYVQSTSFHLNTLGVQKEEQAEIAHKIWDGVSREEQTALALKYIEDKRDSLQASLNDHSARNGTNEEPTGNLKNLIALKDEIDKDTHKIEIWPEDASLVVGPKEVKKEE
jgi:hypothetical protein